MRIVIDTNVLISGIIFGGKPSKIIELLFGKKNICLCFSRNGRRIQKNLWGTWGTIRKKDPQRIKRDYQLNEHSPLPQPH